MQDLYEKELRIKQLRLILCVMFVIFLFMFVYTLYFVVDYNKEYGFFKKTTAEVVEHKKIENYTYDVINYSVDGNEYVITTEYFSKNEIGDKIKIYYDVNNPIGIIYSLDSRRIVLPIIASLFFCVYVALLVVYILMRKSLTRQIKTVSFNNLIN